jgi:hypothetical protein
MARVDPAGQAVPHVLGQDGNIVAILWARRNALHAPPRPDRANKVLWVSRLTLGPASPLRIQATLNGTRRTAEREVPEGPARPTSTCRPLAAGR